MASLTHLCTESLIRIQLYRVVSIIPRYLNFPRTLVLPMEFSGIVLRFAAPVSHLDAALNNAEHVLVDCDYYRLARAVPKQSSIVIDAGAFLGFYTATSSLLAGEGGRVYAFEPNPNIIGYLRLNLELNKLFNTQVYPVALCPDHGRKRLYVGEYPSVSSLLREHVEKYTRVTGVHEVKCVRLSSLLEYLNHVDVLKLDIEGLELDILAEASEGLNRVKNLVVEVHRDTVDLKDVENILFKSGFSIVIYASYKNPQQAIVYAFKP